MLVTSSWGLNNPVVSKLLELDCAFAAKVVFPPSSPRQMNSSLQRSGLPHHRVVSGREVARIEADLAGPFFRAIKASALMTNWLPITFVHYILLSS